RSNAADGSRERDSSPRCPPSRRLEGQTITRQGSLSVIAVIPAGYPGSSGEGGSVEGLEAPDREPPRAVHSGAPAPTAACRGMLGKDRSSRVISATLAAKQLGAQPGRRQEEPCRLHVPIRRSPWNGSARPANRSPASSATPPSSSAPSSPDGTGDGSFARWSASI